MSYVEGVRAVPAGHHRGPDACVTGTLPRHKALPHSTTGRTDGTTRRTDGTHPHPTLSSTDATLKRPSLRALDAGGNTVTMKDILAAIQAPESTSADFAGLPLPESYRAITVHKDETEMFAGLATRDKDPRKSIHLDEVPLPELGPGEALVAVMASSVNYNSVWTSIFEPVSTFAFLERYGRLSPLTKRHDLPYHIIGSDLAGVVLRTGAGVNAWQPGDEVVAHCLSVELESPDGHDDTMLDPEQRIWGFETNFGGLAEIALVKTNQLMPKPKHLTWEEAAAPGLVNSTAYRQLVSRNGAAMKQGDNVLIWARAAASAPTPPSSPSPAAPPRSASSPRRRRPRSAGRWAPSTSSTAMPRATGSGRTRPPRTPRSGSASASASAS